MAKKVVQLRTGKAIQSRSRSGRSARPRRKPLRGKRFFAEKAKAMARVLGPQSGEVIHGYIPLHLGGTADLFLYEKHLDGYVFATQELISDNPRRRSRAGSFGHFELIICLPKRPISEYKQAVKDYEQIRPVLGSAAIYSFQETIEPGDTAEIPTEEGKPPIALLFDEFVPRSKRPSIRGKPFGLLLAMTITLDELVFARKSGVAALVELLRQKNVYPFSRSDRASVLAS